MMFQLSIGNPNSCKFVLLKTPTALILGVLLLHLLKSLPTDLNYLWPVNGISCASKGIPTRHDDRGLSTLLMDRHKGSWPMVLVKVVHTLA